MPFSVNQFAGQFGADVEQVEQLAVEDVNGGAPVGYEGGHCNLLKTAFLESASAEFSAAKTKSREPWRVRGFGLESLR